VTVREGEGLVARIRQIRRAAATAQGARTAASNDPDPSRIELLEARMTHLEQLVEGLQDAVHRESERQAKLINDLQTQIRPAAMSAALSRDARDRGLE
jgi:uncharacterized coiled-coil protein SlyX